MSKKDEDAAWFAKHFPTARARAAADAAINALDPRLSMTAFLDHWIAAYTAAGGQRKTHRD
jgi:hypothetical protein